MVTTTGNPVHTNDHCLRPLPRTGVTEGLRSGLLLLNYLTTIQMKTINIQTRDGNFTTLWLVLWQGALDLTPRERSVLAAILDKYLELEADGLKSPYIFKMCFDADARKEYCEKLSISSFNFTNILGGLREKGAIVEESKGVYTIPEQVLPHKEVLFKFL